MCTEFSTFTFFFSLCVWGCMNIMKYGTKASPLQKMSEVIMIIPIHWRKKNTLLCVGKTISIIFYFRECLLTWRCEDTNVRTTPRCAGSSRRGCTRTGGRRIGGNQTLKTSQFVTSSFWRRIMTGAAVKASAFQVLLLALLFVFTPSLFHLVLFEVFSFLNFLTPWYLWRSQNQAQVLLQCFLALALFYVYWDYARCQRKRMWQWWLL